VIKNTRWLTNENLRITEDELALCRPINAGAKWIRAYCPIHGSDHQRSLRVNHITGHFKCFACGAWGYISNLNGKQGHAMGVATRATKLTTHTEIHTNDCFQALSQYRMNYIGSIGEAYLLRRGIPSELAVQYGIGYSAPGTWLHPNREWTDGRVVFPHTDPTGGI
jgi:DNA primase